MDLICIVPRPHLLGRALTSSHRLSAFLEYIGGFEFAKAGSISLAGKASLVSINDAIVLLRS